jgi:hypothetical protein
MSAENTDFGRKAKAAMVGARLRHREERSDDAIQSP